MIVYLIGQTLYAAYGTPLRNIPGPWLAKFSRIWLFNAINSRKFQTINLEIHRKYGQIIEINSEETSSHALIGPTVRISPNEVSIDDFDASKIIYRSRDEIVKVNLHF